MTEIKCQKCKPEDQGCERCGGYKVIVAKVHLQCCGREYWTRPGVRSMYDGKTWESFDGLGLICKDGKTQCLECGG